jgi:hypothetical protein
MIFVYDILQGRREISQQNGRVRKDTMKRTKKSQDSAPTRMYSSSVLCPFLLQIETSVDIDKRLGKNIHVFFLDLGLIIVVSVHRYYVKVGEKEAHLLFRSKIVDNVEELANLFRGFTFDHIRDSLAPNIAATIDYSATVVSEE